MAFERLSPFTKRRFTAPLASGHRVTRDVYERGAGPAIVILQELPGIVDATVDFADRLTERGYRVVLPHLFGPLGQFSLAGNTARVFCMRREFNLFAKNHTSPIVDWLRALCADVKGAIAPGVGVVGMCLTGNFALSLIADDTVLAAVSAQPSMPLGAQGALHMSDTDIERVKARLDAVGPAHAYRFEGDSICQAAKFEAIDRAFNDDSHVRVQLTTLPGSDHSVFTGHYKDDPDSATRQALEEILGYFDRQLKPSST